MTELIDTVQLQDIGDSLIELFEITLPNETVAYLTPGLEDGLRSIYFDNPKNEYIAIPIQITGLEVSTAGAAPRPSLTMANIPILSRQIGLDEDTMNDILIAGSAVTNEDLLGSTVVVRRTLYKYTQSASEAATAAIEFPSQKFVLDRIAGENSVTVEFELASPMDIEGVKLPSRIVVGKYCPWKYQGVYIDGDGGCNWPLGSAGRFFNINNEVITKDLANDPNIPLYSSGGNSKDDLVYTVENGVTKIWKALRDTPQNAPPGTSPFYWVRLDVCGKLIQSCKVRFQGNNVNDDLDFNVPLPFGGFPGSKQFK